MKKLCIFYLVVTISLLLISSCNNDVQKSNLVHVAKDYFPKFFNSQLPKETKVIKKQEIENWLAQKKPFGNKPFPCNLKKYLEGTSPEALIISIKGVDSSSIAEEVLFFQLPPKFVRGVDCLDKWNSLFVLGKNDCGDAGTCSHCVGEWSGGSGHNCMCVCIMRCCPGSDCSPCPQ